MPATAVPAAVPTPLPLVPRTRPRADALRLAVLGLALLAAGAAVPRASATSFVALSDQDLFAQSPAAARVKVVERQPGVAGGLPSTRFLVEVEEMLKGELPGSRIVVQVPGGVAPDGTGWRVYGAPDFAAGEEAILFLSPRADGTYGIVQLMLGAFHAVRREGRRLALRDLDGARELAVLDGADPLAHEAVRDFDAFAGWVRRSAAGEHPEADYRTGLSTSELGRVTGEYAIFTNSPGQCSDGARRKIRWFNFDSGGSVRWTAAPGGEPGMAGGGFDKFSNALAAWNGAGGSAVRLSYTGTGGGGDGRITFDDPNGEISGSFNCSQGGVLAVGGPSFSCATGTWKGEAYRRAQGGEIVTQDGAGCFFGGHGGEDGEEVFTHELGHTLGLAHSEVTDAVMRATAYGGGRGARLGSDDVAAMAFLYGSGGSTPPPPPPPSSVPAAPSALAAAAQNSTSIFLSWRDNATDETSFRLERSTGGGFAQIGTLGAGLTSVLVTGLVPATGYDFRLRACNGAGCSAYSNVATATTPGAPPPPDPPVDACPAGSLCLADGRFTIAVHWRDQRSGATGVGHPLDGGAKSGYFWFFNPDNFELVVKTLDGRPLNGRYWLFYGALSDVEYWIDVVDRQTGRRHTYHNPPGRICGEADLATFLADGTAPTLGAATTPQEPSPGETLPWELAGSDGAEMSGLCAPSAEVSCLANSRFEVRVDWVNQHAGGARGVGRVSPSPTDGSKTGLFWFFDPANVELVTKMIDGRGANGHFWFFYGGLSDVEYTITVRDTQTSRTRRYTNQAGEICGRGDTAAF